MSRLVFIQSAQTDWRAERRLAGDTNLPLTDLGRQQALAAAAALRSEAPTTLCAGPDEAAKQTARIIAEALSLKPRTVKGLREIHLGHWAGLLEDELRDRFGKVYRQWRSDPLSVQPPDGESLSATAQRLTRAVDKLCRDHPTDVLAVVVGPFAWSILRCELADGSYERFWHYLEGAETTYRLDRDAPDHSEPVR